MLAQPFDATLLHNLIPHVMPQQLIRYRKGAAQIMELF